MKFETFEYTLPAHWVGAIFYGELDGIDDPDEEHAIQLVLEDIGIGSVELKDDSAFFCKYHDAQPWGVLPCDCYTYVIHRPVR